VRRAFAAGAALATLAGAAGSAPPPADRCAALAGLRIPAARIGLPTRGADVTQALPVAGAPGRAAHCQVLGRIHPIDRSAPDIRFELDLPEAWNGKALMVGGGGFDGVIPDTAGPLLDQPSPQILGPLARGYAVFGGDSGHQAANPAAPAPVVDGAFALNDEAFANYAGDAVKKTRDAAAALIARRYGRPAARTYVVGGSNGGREAFVAISRWPGDFDGAIAAFPFRDAGTTALAFGAVYRAFAAPGAYPDAAKRALVHAAAVKACDGLDGLEDGLVSNVEACRFDPAGLRCPGGGDTGDTCLSDAQIAALRTYARPFAFPERPAGAERGYPGYTVLAGGQIQDAQLGAAAPTFPPATAMPLSAWYWDQLARFAIARDPALDPRTLDPAHPGRLAGRLNAVVDRLDAPATDLGRFRARGGKLIVYHGLADPLVSHRATAAYWRRLEAAMGPAAVRGFARFYVIPGYGHGSGDFLPVWDPLAVLEAWAERGEPPGPLTVADAQPAGRGRARPLCEHGAWPRYDGGDPQAAASFHCQKDGARE
jgi:feruloyl esterase